MALYRHVRNKDELLDGMVDAVGPGCDDQFEFAPDRVRAQAGRVTSSSSSTT